MMRLTSVLLTFALFFIACSADDEDPGQVEVLTESNFESKTKEGVWLIKFYSPNCGFCKMMAPEWKKLAKESIEDELPLTIAQVNVREARSVSQKMNIGKLPGVKLIVNGKVYTLPDARKGRTVEDYLEYALEDYEKVEAEEAARVAEEKRKFEEMEANSDVVKLTLDNFEELTSQGNWLIEFYGPKCGYCKKLQPTWEELGTKVNTDETMGFKVAKFDAAAGFKYTSQFKANPWPSIKLVHEGEAYTFPDPRNFDHSLEAYIEFAQSGYKGTGKIELAYVAAQKKRAARKAKYAKKKNDKKHEEL